MMETDYSSHLPPYRSLLTPDSRYDYTTHQLIPITQHELNTWYNKLQQRNNHNLTFKSLNNRPNVVGLKMKYKSLLSDVSRSLSMRISNSNLLGIGNTPPVPISATSTITFPPIPINRVVQFHTLPIEILDYVFFLINNKDDYKSCMYVNRLFYFFSKLYYYERLEFTSTYRFAQFILYLRLNSDVGQYVKSIDMSGIKAGLDDRVIEDAENIQMGNITEDLAQLGNQPIHQHVDFDDSPKVLAGWRDWKVKSYPLYSINSTSQVSLTKTHTNVSTKSSKSTKSTKLSSIKNRIFRSNKRRRSSSGPTSRKAQKVSREELYDIPPILQRNASSHPLMNKFLLNYSTSKDIPIGYILHLINLCPNVESLNLGGLSLSTDYEVNKSAMYKFLTFDLIHNYPKTLVKQVEDLMNLEEYADNLTIHESILSYRSTKQSSASSVYSYFPKGVIDVPDAIAPRKYNSLLPPLPDTVVDMSYMKKGDGKVYLSDLNLKSLNGIYLKKISEDELLEVILKLHGSSSRLRLTRDLRNQHYMSIHTLKYIELSSMIWLTRELVQKFLTSMIGSYDTHFESVDCDSDLDSEGSIESTTPRKDIEIAAMRQDLVIDLTNSGMYNNLKWAKVIDLNTRGGCRLAWKIINNKVIDPVEERIWRGRNRRGRIGENYLA